MRKPFTQSNLWWPDKPSNPFHMKTIWKLASLAYLLFFMSACTEVAGDPNSDNDDVQKFLGTWSVSDLPARVNYSVKIERVPLNDNQVILNNFGDLGGQATGLVVNNTIVIDLQNIGSGYQSEGSGTYVNSKQLQFEFFLDDGIDKELRKATFSK